MPHWHTPEALLPRSDSRLGSETCRGICVNGKRCRRKLSPPTTPVRSYAFNACLEPAAVKSQYCWQHQPKHGDNNNDDPVTRPATAKSPARPTVKSRPSLETLAEKMGILRIDEEEKRPLRRDTKPNRDAAKDVPEIRPRTRQQKAAAAKSPGLMASLCCLGLSSKDDFAVVRYPRRAQMSEKQQTSVAVPPRIPARKPAPRPTKPLHSPTPSPASHPWIPATVDTRTLALLYLELAKPLSPAESPGYIYMYWLTPASQPLPAATTLQTHMPSPSASWQESSSQASVTSSASSQLLTTTPTVLVKIGRATNVHQRLHAWQRQCGYQLSLLRFYPYVAQPISSSAAERLEIKTVPFSHRVERLIQIELEGRRARQGRCGSCGRAHREWFEIEATEAGLAEVDATIKRWVAWGLQHQV